MQPLDVQPCLLAPLCQSLLLLLLLTARLLHGCFYILPAKCQQESLLAEFELHILLQEDQQDISNTVQQHLLCAFAGDIFGCISSLLDSSMAVSMYCLQNANKMPLLAECQLYILPAECQQESLLAECQLYVLPAECQQNTLLAECQLNTLPAED